MVYHFRVHTPWKCRKICTDLQKFSLCNHYCKILVSFIQNVSLLYYFITLYMWQRKPIILNEICNFSYYKYVPNLPERLQPQCMMRQYGLRACVIRALYYNYFPLLNYLLYFRRDRPHSLVRRKCTHMWHKVSFNIAV